ncbi:hypothetical protein MTO96_003202 [Rhipicephalus appendiculatus]
MRDSFQTGCSSGSFHRSVVPSFFLVIFVSDSCDALSAVFPRNPWHRLRCPSESMDARMERCDVPPPPPLTTVLDTAWCRSTLLRLPLPVSRSPERTCRDAATRRTRPWKKNCEDR